MSTENIRVEFDALQSIVDSDPRGTLTRAADIARDHDDPLIRLLAPVFEQWAFVSRFGDLILRTGGPETVAVARTLLASKETPTDA